MEVAKIKVCGASARSVHNRTITSGMVGATVAFEFDSLWDGLSKTAVFCAGDVTKDVLDISTEVAIPPEVLVKPGQMLYVGVYGINADGTQVIPTVWVNLCGITSGADPSGDPSTDLTPEVWAQLQAQIDALKEQGVDAESVKSAVEAYMAANPPAEADPTVPAWAKAETKPTYTAAEVGALPDTTEIPVVPTKVSAFENDKGYLTEHQDLGGYAKTTEIPTDDHINQLINTALAAIPNAAEVAY